MIDSGTRSWRKPYPGKLANIWKPELGEENQIGDHGPQSGANNTP
jgi:hypothetical protein